MPLLLHDQSLGIHHSGLSAGRRDHSVAAGMRELHPFSLVPGNKRAKKVAKSLLSQKPTVPIHTPENG